MDNNSPSYTVKTGSFEGPLELLLDLIEKRKLFINEISLSAVADDYIRYVQTLREFPIAESANFILIASTLLLIKSKSLLPNLALTEEEAGNIHDLEIRLRLYKRLRELGNHIRGSFGKRVLFELNERPQEVVFSPDQNTTAEGVLGAIRDVLSHFPKKEFLPRVVLMKVMSIEEMIENLTSRVANELRMSFRQFAASHKEKNRAHLIISFLAMLELVKQGVISVTQDKHFSDIIMETEGIGTPHYG